MRLAAAVLAALVLAPAAGAWTRLTPDALPNISEPVALRTAAGTELIAYSDFDHDVSVIRRPGGSVAVVSGWLGVGAPALAQKPDGTLLLYFAGTSPGFAQQGVVVSTSTDNGATWAAPQLTNEHNLSEVHGAAVRPDGTPMFTQSGTGFLMIHQGLLGEVARNAFPFCCPYDETLGVDATGLAQVAFYSNATNQSGFLYATLDGSGNLVKLMNLSGGAQTVQRVDRVPLATDLGGNTFVAWFPGYPSETAVEVTTLAGGNVVQTKKVAAVRGNSHAALAVDRQSFVWAVWTNAGSLYAARSRSSGASFGQAVRVALPAGSTAYQLSAIAPAGGGVDAFANLATTGKSALWTQHLLPGLTVAATRTGVRVTDDGVPVAGATVRSGTRRATTNAAGRAALRLRRGARVTVTKAGYTTASAFVR